MQPHAAAVTVTPLAHPEGLAAPQDLSVAWQFELRNDQVIALTERTDF